MSAGVSIREFAERLGVSDTSVHKAIKSGKISEKWIDRSNVKRPKISPLEAAEEWGKNWNPAYVRTDVISDNIKVSTTRERARGKSITSTAENGTEEGRKMAEVARKKSEISLQVAALDLQVKKGKYVDKEKVYKALYVAGQEIRTMFQTLPDRVIDNILAAKSRHDAHEILTDAIADALEQMADSVNRDMML